MGTIGLTRYLPYYPPLANYFQKFSGGIPYAGYRKNCFLTYMMPCYLVARGGTRYKSIINNIYAQAGNENDAPGNTPNTSWNYAERTGIRADSWKSENYEAINWQTMHIEPTSETSQTLREWYPKGVNGACYTSNTYNPTLEFQQPFYSNTRFMLGTTLLNQNDDDYDLKLIRNPTMTQILSVKQSLTGRGLIYAPLPLWFAAADDFSLSYYLAPPVEFIFETT